MTSASSAHTPEQVTAWLRGLLSIALADNNFSPEEKSLFKELRQGQPLDADHDPDHLQPITPEALAECFGSNDSLAQNFLRTAVMMAMVDGEYSDTEDALIHRYANALGQEIKEMVALRAHLAGSLAEEQDVLTPVKNWLDHLEVKDQRLARFLCRAIPSQCPFERDVVLFGRKVAHIPPMCKLNPLYDQLVGLRFRSLCYLADDCGEDVAEFC